MDYTLLIAIDVLALRIPNLFIMLSCSLDSAIDKFVAFHSGARCSYPGVHLFTATLSKHANLFKFASPAYSLQIFYHLWILQSISYPQGHLPVYPNTCVSAKMSYVTVDCKDDIASKSQDIAKNCACCQCFRQIL